MYKDFWRIYIKEYNGFRAGLAIVVVTVVVSVIEGLNVALLVPLLENVGSTPGDDSHWVSRWIAGIFIWLGIPFGLGQILVALGILTFAMASLKYFRHWLMVKASMGFVSWLRTKNMWNLLNADISYFHSARIGLLTDMLLTQSGRSGGSLINITQILTNVGLVVAYLGTAFLITPILTSAAIAMLVIVALITQYFIKQANRMGLLVVESENNFSASTVEDLSGIRVIKGFLVERLRWQGFKSKTDLVMDSTVRLNMNSQRMAFIQEVAIFGLIGTLVFVGVNVFGLELAVLVTLLFVLYRLSPRITTINHSRHELGVAMAALRTIDTAINSTAKPTLVSGDTKFSGLINEISLIDLDFSYSGTSKVLKNINFSITKGTTTAIVGASGTGKSTIIDLLLRFYDPTQGSVTVDGINLKEFNTASWRSAIGVVNQDVFLFNDTIANNISLKRDRISHDQIVEAAEQAYAHEFINRLPLGYETILGERGLNLSGGERQRIALARAIVTKPEILVLDEATSSLDSESEELILNYMRQIRGTCTMVVVAHRFSTIQDADKIVVLRDGQIAEEGKWDELVNGDGAFANYYRLQAGSENMEVGVSDNMQGLAHVFPSRISQSNYQQERLTEDEPD